MIRFITCLMLFIALLVSCATTQNNQDIIDKTYYHTYLYSSMGNEYGKGGGKHYLSLAFKKDSVTLLNIKEKSLPNEKGEYITTQDVEKVFSTTYQSSSDMIKIDNSILPDLKITGDTLIASQVNIKAGPSDIFKNSKFVLGNH